MYALRDYIGEERVNAALRRLLADWAFQGPPYATARDLVDHLRAETPDSLQYVITDLFEEITLWDNRATEATARELPDGRWEVTMSLTARKLRVDSLGYEQEVPMDEWVDVGVYAEEREGRRTREVPVYLEKHRIRTGTNEVRVMVDRRPVRAGIDPLHKLTDRIARDNTVRVGFD
jgi:ABC-2 type transport system permease protein